MMSGLSAFLKNRLGQNQENHKKMIPLHHKKTSEHANAHIRMSKLIINLKTPCDTMLQYLSQKWVADFPPYIHH